MGGMRIDPKELPLHLQEQVAMAFVAQPAKANPVAGREVKRPVIKVSVKRLCFVPANGAERYLMLQDAVCEGVISNLRTVGYDGRIRAFTYEIQWDGKILPHTIPIRTLLWWRERVREYGVGVMVYERIERKCQKEAQK